MSTKLLQGDCLELIKSIPDKSINVILTDPPYKYLKYQKLEVDFDEKIFFSHAKRILKPNGFIILFGRGASFYRWNTILDDNGFDFKEEIIWDKSQNTSPVTPINRCHETISIWSLGNAPINQVHVPYMEIKGANLSKMQNDISRICTAFKDNARFQEIYDYLYKGEITFKDTNRTLGDNITVQSAMKQQDRTLKVVQSIHIGMKEKSIINITRDHYQKFHPTSKPVRLLERLLALVSKEGDLVLDPFAGSCSTAIACQNLQRDFIGYEIDQEYYEKAKERIENHVSQLEMKIA